MNRKLITKVLDKAITKVVCDEFNRISKNLSDVETARKVEYALDQLSNLQRGVMPKYDEWVAPFYVSWYQPAQINLAYSMIVAMLKETFDGVLAPTGKLYVYDFGCGALAMQFGVALAAADALRNGQKLDSVYIASSDTSKAMLSIGAKVWEQFKSEVRKEPRLSYLSQACDLVKTQFVRHSLARKPSVDEMCWLSAIHTAYKTNQEEVKSDLDLLRADLNPDIGFATSHIMELSVVNFISPFRRNDKYARHPEIVVYPVFEGGLPKITEWRRTCSNLLLNPSGRTINYLFKPVSWKWPSATIQIYTRRQQ